jgi:hypothetical protein
MGRALQILFPFPLGKGLGVRFLLRAPSSLSFRAAAAKNPDSVLPLPLFRERIKGEGPITALSARFKIPLAYLNKTNVF